MKLPTADLTKAYLGIGTLLYILCFVVYGLTNWWATQRSDLYHWYFTWELSLPFVPEFVYVYLSLSAFLLLPLFYMKESAVKSWALSYVVMTLVAGLIFALFPTTLGVARSPAMAENMAVFALIYTLDMPHNLFPSLHIAYTTFALHIVIYFGANRRFLLLIFCWWLLLTLSVILVRQHHLLDIVGGVALAFFCYRFVFLKKYPGASQLTP